MRALTGRAVLACVILGLMVQTSGCAKNLKSNVYVDNAVVTKVIEGQVISARQVVVQANSKLQDNQLGGAAGGITGFVAGSAIGKGKGSLATAIGGALIGAAAGALAEQGLSKQNAIEYMVRIDPKYIAKGEQSQKKKHRIERVSGVRGDVNADLSESVEVADTQTDIITVIQNDDTMIPVGKKVFVQYANDRPRLVPQS